jgi:hypothetical protein
VAEWTEVQTQEDGDTLLNVFGGFHDSCIREAHLATGHWVSANLAMTCSGGADSRIQLLVQRQFQNPSAILLHFEEVTRFNLVAAQEHCDSIILEATLLVRDGTIFWSVEGNCSPDSANRDAVTWVSARRLRWRAVDWLGDELRFGSK